MATSGTESLDAGTELKTACPICFESFKTPRYLPCYHTFCHNCLSSYILSTCKSKDNPVCFPCPLCRQFVPAPSFLGEPEKWTELIPINTIIQALCEKKDQFCDACRRANEEEVATDWCGSCLESLCAFCAKAHKRSAASQDHTLVSKADIGKIPIEIERRALCDNHSAPVNYVCVDHEELCCAECLFTQHRKCNQVVEVEKTAEGLLQSDTLDKLAQKIQQYEDCLVQAKTEGEETIKYIDETSDKILEESTELRDKVLKHITNVVETHFTDLAKKVKEEKERLVNFVYTVSDRKLLVARYAQTLKETEKTPLPILVQDYLKIKQQFNDLTKLGLHRLVVKLHSDASKELLRILECFRLEEVKMMTVSIPLGGLDFTSAKMKMVCELPDSDGDVTGGCYLENGDIVLARLSSKECLYYRNEKLWIIH
uniref:Tripartite motif-containing protein 45-like n=1 Tax=Crassostrea virginica TaxID=6565 RepID=A0A8B8BXE2_CRAVI|nr:tripartite motif-containing protein 45-like [Crassostrea virginica]